MPSYKHSEQMQSDYHYVESSSKLFNNEEEEEEEAEDIISLASPINESPSFYQNEDEDYENEVAVNKDLHEKRHRKLSLGKDISHKINIPISVATSLPKNAEINQNRRRTNSFNGAKLPTHNRHHEPKNHHKRASNNGIDMVDFRSSFKKIINAGKQMIPEPTQFADQFQRGISVNLTSPQYSRSQSYNQAQSYEETLTDKLLNSQHEHNESKGSKINYLNKSYDEKQTMNFHDHLKTVSNPISLPEEVSLTSSSTSQSSTPSSSVTKNREKLFFDANNNHCEIKQPLCELVHLQDLTVIHSKKSESVRMRHNSSKASLLNQNPVTLTKVPSMGMIGTDSNNNFIDSSSDNCQIGFEGKSGSKFKNNRRSDHHNNYFVITLLFVLNLLNYIDRYTLAGVLRETQDYFGINDSESGLLQTVFICSYMLLAPLFGYLGDRYPRKWLIIFGISFWSFMTFVGSFVPRDKFWLFALIRSFVGIGEASYSCVAPTIIGDLFTAETRTHMLAIFYLAVPVGSGMGYIVGSNISQAFGDWRWALRFTPPLGMLCVILLIFFVQEPKRGGAEGSKQEISNSSVIDDLIYLLKNKTYMWITTGFTFASFVLGGLSWWVPTYVEYAIQSKNQEPIQIPLYFGIITCFSGLFGVGFSSVLAPKLREFTKRADPYVCALGSFIAVPTLYTILLVTRAAPAVVFWGLVCIAISAMCLSWTIVADILLYVIHPTKRSIASAFNILICHLFGDAFSPYVIGAISDSLRSGKPDSYFVRFESLKMALFAAPFFALLSFAAYLFAGLYVEEDKKKVELIIKKGQKNLSDPSLTNEGINGSSDPAFSTEQLVDNINENESKVPRDKPIYKNSDETLNNDSEVPIL